MGISLKNLMIFIVLAIGPALSSADGSVPLTWTCDGSAFTKSDAIKFFAAGQTVANLWQSDYYNGHLSYRSCTALTGCGSWGSVGSLPSSSLLTLVSGQEIQLSFRVGSAYWDPAGNVGSVNSSDIAKAYFKATSRFDGEAAQNFPQFWDESKTGKKVFNARLNKNCMEVHITSESKPDSAGFYQQWDMAFAAGF